MLGSSHFRPLQEQQVFLTPVPDLQTHMLTLNFLHRCWGSELRFLHLPDRDFTEPSPWPHVAEPFTGEFPDHWEVLSHFPPSCWPSSTESSQALFLRPMALLLQQCSCKDQVQRQSSGTAYSASAPALYPTAVSLTSSLIFLQHN